MLNLSYGVNVKLYSMNLLLMAMFLLAPDISALSDLLIFRRVATPSDGPARLLQGRSLRVGTAIVALLFVGAASYNISATKWWYEQYYVHPVVPPLSGVYDVETFTRNGTALPLGDNSRWTALAFDATWSGVAGGSLHLRMTGLPANTRNFDLQYDPAVRRITLTGHFDRSVGGTMTYASVDQEHVQLDGTLGDDRLSVRLRKVDVSQFRLVKRKPFRWVQP